MNYTYTQRVKRPKKGRFKAIIDDLFFYLAIFGLILLFFPVVCFSIIHSEVNGIKQRRMEYELISTNNGERRTK